MEFIKIDNERPSDRTAKVNQPGAVPKRPIPYMIIVIYFTKS